MADFPTASPPDATEIATYIRFWLGNITTNVISESDLLSIINNTILIYPDSICKSTYFSTVEVLRWLIRSNSSDIGSSDVSGGITKREEKNGNKSIKIEYQDTDNDIIGWEKTLEDLLEDPRSIGCDPFSDQDPKINNVIIGGADINGYQESFATKRRFNLASQENRYIRRGRY